MKIENRIAQLRKGAIEYGGKINESSLEDFTNFAQLLDAVIAVRLVISLTPENDIYTSWLSEDNRYSFHFKGNGDIDFVVMKESK